MTHPDGLDVVGPKASDNLWFRIRLMAVSDMCHALKFLELRPLPRIERSGSGLGHRAAI